MCLEVPEGTRCLSHSRASAAHAGEGNRHAQGLRRSARCGHGSPRIQGSREDARCMSLGRGRHPRRGCARARRVATLRSPERAHAAPDMGRAVRCGHAGKTHTEVSRRGPRGVHAAATSCHTQGRTPAVRRGPGGARTADIKIDSFAHPGGARTACRTAGASARCKTARGRGACRRHAQGSRRSTHCGHGIYSLAQGSRRSTRCRHGLPRVQRFREGARCLTLGRGGRPLRGCAQASMGCPGCSRSAGVSARCEVARRQAWVVPAAEVPRGRSLLVARQGRTPAARSRACKAGRRAQESRGHALLLAWDAWCTRREAGALQGEWPCADVPRNSTLQAWVAPIAREGGKGGARLRMGRGGRTLQV
jgi:hypothetical protein